MATVLLPMGYPLQSGQQFDHIIYQGQMVRSYTLPKDPRSNAQLSQRRFLFDLTKMRSTLGWWGREACKTAMGEKWSSVLFQAIKADVGGWWTSALAEWETFIEFDREAWRTAAPFKATFNDMGQIFFCLVRLVYRALLFFGSHAFKCVEWTASQSAAALAWWNEFDFGHAAKGSDIDFNYFPYTRVGSWQEISAAGAMNNVYLRGTSLTSELEFYYLGRTINIYYVNHVVGTFEIILNGVFNRQRACYAVEPAQFNFVEQIGTSEKRLRHIKIKAVTAGFGLNYFRVY